MRKLLLGLLVLGLTPASWADSIFVKETYAPSASTEQREQTTEAVRNAVLSMSEHALVSSESMADLVLQPNLLNRGDQFVLRLEGLRDGTIIATSERQLPRLPVDQGVARSATRDTLSTNASAQPEDAAVAGTGESRSTGDFVRDVNARGRWTIGVGPAFGVGFESDDVMYNLSGGYIYDFSEIVSGKVMADLNLGSGNDSSRFNTFSVGGNFYANRMDLPGRARPYVMADAGYAFVRDDLDRIEDAPAIGAGAGIEFDAQDLQMDLALHYTLLTTEIEDDTPSVLGIRFAVNF